MQLLSKETKETVYKIEFTEKELNTLFLAFDKSTVSEIEEANQTKYLKTLNIEEQDELYAKLKDLILEN